MDARQFRNTFAILHNLDKQELEDASVLIPDANGGSDWSRFTNGIGTFVLKLPTDRLEKLYALIDGRQPDKYRDVPPLTFGYTNWRGKFEQRTIRPRKVWFGKTDWHPEPQWLLTGFDVEKDAERDFAIKDIGNGQSVQVEQAIDVALDLIVENSETVGGAEARPPGHVFLLTPKPNDMMCKSRVHLDARKRTWRELILSALPTTVPQPTVTATDALTAASHALRSYQYGNGLTRPDREHC